MQRFTVNAGFLREVVSTLPNWRSESNIYVNKEGLHIISIDQGRVALHHTFIPKDSFDKVPKVEECKLQLNLMINWKPILNYTFPHEEIYLTWVNKKNSLQFKSKITKGTIHFDEVSMQKIEYEPMEKIVYSNKIRAKLADFINLMQVKEYNWADIITLYVDQSNFYLKLNLQRRFRNKSQSHPKRKLENFIIHEGEDEFSQEFSFIHIFNCLKRYIGPEIEVYMEPDQPLKIVNYFQNRKGYVSYYFAPRLREEGTKY
jgi:hypothetical protein